MAVAEVPALTDNQPRLRFPRPNDVFQVRISLLEIEPRIWRRLLVAQNMPLPRFHSVIQAAMGWTDSHLYQFKVGEVCFGEPTLEYEPGPIDHRRIALNQILPRRGVSCVYEYDFGDGWEHLIEVEDEVPADAVTVPVPRCVAGERACPPEDCGGSHGYADFVAAIRDPKHPERYEYLQWVGGQFDPEAFDLEQVNQLLARFAARAPQRRVPRKV